MSNHKTESPHKISPILLILSVDDIEADNDNSQSVYCDTQKL